MIDFNIDKLQFLVDDDIKKAYFKQKPIQTAKADYPVFALLDEYEKLD